MNRRNFIRMGLGSMLAISLALSLAVPAAFAGSEDELRARWEAMPAEKKALLQERWKQFQAMSPEQQQKLRAALERYQALPAATQERIQQNFERWKKYSPEQKAAVRKNFQEFKALSEAEQEKLRAENKGGNTAK